MNKTRPGGRRLLRSKAAAPPSDMHSTGTSQEPCKRSQVPGPGAVFRHPGHKARREMQNETARELHAKSLEIWCSWTTGLGRSHTTPPSTIKSESTHFDLVICHDMPLETYLPDPVWRPLHSLHQQIGEGAVDGRVEGLEHPRHVRATVQVQALWYVGMLFLPLASSGRDSHSRVVCH